MTPIVAIVTTISTLIAATNSHTSQRQAIIISICQLLPIVTPIGTLLVATNYDTIQCHHVICYVIMTLNTLNKYVCM